MIPLSIEESINRLKAEIIAQDWRISPKRAEMIEAALLCLQQHFQERKATHAMLVMALSVLDYIRRKGGTPSETVDFLKEAMAHVVGQYEDLEYNPSREDQIFRSLFSHFTKLKDIIKTGRKPSPPRPTAAKEELYRPPPIKPSQPEPRQSDTTSPLESVEAEKLINDLRDSLERAGSVGSTIGELLGQLIAGKQTKTSFPQPLGSTLFSPTPPVAWSAQQSIDKEADENSCPGPVSTDGIKSCPPTELRTFSIGGVKLAVQENLVAAVKHLGPSKIKACLLKSNIPTKAFGSFLQSLSSQFKGPLGKLRPSKLKKISLPIMVPQGLDLPETPDEQALDLLVLSNGSWHGILACQNVKQHPQSMTKFHKKQNGDIAGSAYMENEDEVLLLDSLSLLRREGFLVTPS